MFFFTLKKIGQSGGASRWRVCYQRGLPRLVYLGIGAMMQKLGNVECSPLYSIFLHEGSNLKVRGEIVSSYFLGNIYCLKYIAHDVMVMV